MAQSSVESASLLIEIEDFFDGVFDLLLDGVSGARSKAANSQLTRMLSVRTFLDTFCNFMTSRGDRVGRFIRSALVRS